MRSKNEAKAKQKYNTPYNDSVYYPIIKKDGTVEWQPIS